jgi:hypothetical protein
MILQSINFANLIQGFTAMILVSVAMIIGVKISLRYFDLEKSKRDKNNYILGIGLGWALLTSPWWLEVLSLMALLSGVVLPEFIAVVLGTVLLPITLYIWGYSSRKIIHGKLMDYTYYVIIFFAVIFQGILIFSYFYDYTLIATRPNVGLRPTDLLSTLFVITLFFFVGLGLTFSIKTYKMGEDKKVRGIFLILAFLFFLVGTLLDATLSWAGLSFAVPIIVRVIQVSSSLLFYLGYFYRN